MTKAILTDWRFHLLLWAVFLTAALPFGPQATMGLGLGLLGTGVSVVGTALITRFLGRTMADSEPLPEEKVKKTSRWGGAATVVFFLIKLPVFGVCVVAAQGLGGPGLPAFGVGILLVYSQLVAWVQAGP